MSTPDVDPGIEPVLLEPVRVAPSQKGDFGLSVQAKFGLRFLYSLRIDSAFIKGIRNNGPAAIAGAKAGDEVLEINGMPIKGLSVLNLKSKFPSEIHIGDQLTMRVQSPGQDASREIVLIADSLPRLLDQPAVIPVDVAPDIEPLLVPVSPEGSHTPG